MSKRRWYIWGSMLLSIVGFQACDLLNPEEQLPVYLKLNTPVVIDPITGFEEDLGIKDLWIDHNGQRLGVFQVPSVIPMLPDEDRNQLTIQAGIFENGLGVIRSPYPFWSPITLEAEVEPLDTLVLDLSFDYWPVDSVIEYRYSYDFEDASPAFSLTNQDNNATIRNASPGYRSPRAGFVRFDEDAYRFEATLDEAFRLPQSNNNDVYLEMTYRSNVPFTWGLAYATVFTGSSGVLPLGVTFFSNLEWRTVYLHIGDLVRSIPDDAIFTPYIQAVSYDSENDIGIPGEIWLDNVRIIQFKE